MAVMDCDRRVVCESDSDYKERMEYNIRVPYDAYIEGRANFLCGKGKTFGGDDPCDVADYLRDECSEEMYDGVAVADKQIECCGEMLRYNMLAGSDTPIPFLYLSPVEYVDSDTKRAREIATEILGLATSEDAIDELVNIAEGLEYICKLLEE